MDLYSSVTDIKGVGDKTAKTLAKLNIFTVSDLVHHFPRKYHRYEEPKMLAEMAANRGEPAAFVGTITASGTLRHVRNLTILTFTVRDGQEEGVRVTFFNMPYLAKSLKAGSKYVFYGTVYLKGSQLCMDHPKLYKVEEYRAMIGRLQPVYALTKGVTNEALTKYIQAALSGLKKVPEYLPETIVTKHGFADYMTVLSKIHMPQNTQEMTQARARLTYEEFFFFVLSMKLQKNGEAVQKGEPFVETAYENRLIEALPYRLTASQQKAWEEIKADLTGGLANRLIQGDVGSGKTILAILSLLMCVVNGFQGAMMAPTEVLATQHFELLQEMIRDYDLPFCPVLLVGSMTAKNKRLAKEGIADGSYNVIIGTHALIQDDVVYHNLALVVTDEQHRFGVKQRNILTQKGNRVHTLVMSATPIPRSLAIILYGDLSVSTIPEKPANRLPIKNCVIRPQDRPAAYRFIEKEVASGHQCYVICPMIESGVMDELENVITYTEKLQQILPKTIRVSFLHGKMKPQVKNQVMADFAEGRFDVLVSTTVIEVGINVPNATFMLIENADRFGLAALHQIRGRVGRGAAQSYCTFVDSKASKASRERLEILNTSNDGFYIAKEDLRLRGPGDLTGTLQSGALSFKFADIYADSEMLVAAAKDVDELLKEDPLLTSEALKPCRQKCESYVAQQYVTTI